MTAVILLIAMFRSTDSAIKKDEVVLFFPSVGRLAEDGSRWKVEISGWIFEPEADSKKRAVLLKLLRNALGLGENVVEKGTFKKRAHWFLVDNERGKRVSIQLGDKAYELEKSESNGHFRGELTLGLDEARRLLSGQEGLNGRLGFQAVTSEGDSRVFPGVIRLVEQTGLSIISDIDDTIKVSEVRNRKALLLNTFSREFRAVPEMTDVYAKWAKSGARFHYLTASPWQLYEPLSSFLHTAKFPPATTFHMRNFRWRDTSSLALFSSSENYKRQRIESLIEAFPRRRFVLVGDSGEKDPEIYGAIARQHPSSVQRIFIRDVAGEDTDSARIQQAFDGVPSEKWTLFRDASEIGEVLGDSRLPDVRPPEESGSGTE